MEQSNVNADPEALLAALHAERETAEQEARRRAEADEDDAEVAKFFSRITDGKPTTSTDLKGKGKAAPVEGDDGEDGAENGADDGEETALPGLTIKRRAAPAGAGEPSVASLLAAKGRVLDSAPVASNRAATGAAGAAANPQQVKRKREGMQKLLGIKKKTKA